MWVRPLVGVSAGIIALLALALHPHLLVAVAAGAALGLAVALLLHVRRRLLARRRAPRRTAVLGPAVVYQLATTRLELPSRARARRRRGTVAAISMGAAALGLALALALGSGSNDMSSNQKPLLRALPGMTRPVVPLSSVVAVPYGGLVRYVDATGRWRWVERVRIPCRLLPDRGAVLRPGIRGGWRFAGLRGAHASFALYRRTTTFAIATPMWPLTEGRTLRLPVLRSPRFPTVTLVPRDGSVVLLQAPERMIRGTDPAAEHNTFASEDTFTLRVNGAEDDSSERAFRFEIANGIGRNAAVATLSGITGWGVVRWLFVVLFGTVVEFFVGRWLRRRSLDPPT